MGRRTQLVPNSVTLVTVGMVGYLPKIASVSPDTINDSIAHQEVDSSTADFIQFGDGTFNTRNTLENIRTQHGIISDGGIPLSVVLGHGANVGRSEAINIGYGDVTTTRGAIGGVGAIAIGALASAHGSLADKTISGRGNIAIGINAGAETAGLNQDDTAHIINIGADSAAFAGQGQGTISIGYGNDSESGAIIIGEQSLSIGGDPDGPPSNQICIGNFSIVGFSSSDVENIGIGHFLDIDSVAFTIGIGNHWLLTSGGDKSVVIGHQTDSPNQISHNKTECIVLGMWTGNSTLTPGDHYALIGHNDCDIQHVVIGQGGEPITSPSARVLEFTNADGVDNAAGDVTIIAPLSTGAATGARFVFQVGVPHASDAALQTPTTMMVIDENGVSFVGGVVSAVKVITAADSPYAVLASDEKILVNTSGGNVQVTLPAIPSNGRDVIVKKITTDANTLTIARNGNNIEGAATNLATSSGTLPSYSLVWETTTGSWWIY